MNSIIISTFYFLLTVASHAVLRRIVPRANIVGIFLMAVAFSGLGLLLDLVVIMKTGLFELVAAEFLYLFLCELYLFAFTFAFGSVSASVLLTCLVRRSSHKESVYAGQEIMVRRRLDGLLGSGLVSEKSGFYFTTSKGRIVAFGYRTLRAFFRHSEMKVVSSVPIPTR